MSDRLPSAAPARAATSPREEAVEPAERAAPSLGEAEVDRLLVERVRQGERAAFDVLVRKYQHRILHAVQRYVGDPHDAEDVAQEAFLRAFRALDGFRGDSSFYTWLFRIAVNAAKNWLVAQGRRPPGDDIDIDDALRIEAAHRLRDPATPEREMMRREMERIVTETLKELPAELSRALTLREVDGLSYEQIARVMGCPIGTVRSRIFRAREAIDRRLRPLLDDRE